MSHSASAAKERTSEFINNAFYDDLGRDWYERDDHPVALLRAEGKLKAQWISARIGDCRSVLDVACGGGLLTNELARRTLQGELELSRICGVDLSEESLAVARAHDPSGKVAYRNADALKLPFEDGEFDCVTMMDFLEHVEDPAAIVAEAARVLRPGGKFIFHTFNRTWLSRLLVIRGVEWFVRNTPAQMHVYRLFVKPRELERFCERAGLQAREWSGIRPVFLSRAMGHLLRTRKVSEDFRFTLSGSLRVGYIGLALKRRSGD